MSTQVTGQLNVGQSTELAVVQTHTAGDPDLVLWLLPEWSKWEWSSSIFLAH